MLVLADFDDTHEMYSVSTPLAGGYSFNRICSTELLPVMESIQLGIESLWCPSDG